jgi:hypothetical protein
MKKILLALGLLGAVALARPEPAAAHVSFSLGLPGFGLFINEPGPPVVYAPPPVYYGYGPPAVAYRPGPYYYPAYRSWRSWPRHRDWYGRGRHYRY